MTRDVIAWPDRVGVAVLYLLLAASLWLAYDTRTPLPGPFFSTPWQQAVSEEVRNALPAVFEAELFGLSFWLLLRLLDWVLGGPIRRQEAWLDAQSLRTQEFRLSQNYGWEEVVHDVGGETSDYLDRLAIAEGYIYKFETRLGDVRNSSITFVASKPHKRTGV